MNPVERRTVGIVDVKFGENVTVIEPANLYGCEIGDETFIEIGRASCRERVYVLV